MAGERPKALLTGTLPGPDTEPQPAEPRRTDARRTGLRTESFSGSEDPTATWWGCPHGPQEGRPPRLQGEGQGPVRKKATERYSGPKPVKKPPETPDRGPLAMTTGLGCASTVPVAGKSHTRKKTVVVGAGTWRRGQGAVGSQPGPRGCCPHTVRATATLLRAVLLPGPAGLKQGPAAPAASAKILKAGPRVVSELLGQGSVLSLTHHFSA